MNDVFICGCTLLGGLKQSVYTVVSKIYGWHEGVNNFRELMNVLMDQIFCLIRDSRIGYCIGLSTSDFKTGPFTEPDKSGPHIYTRFL